MIKERISKMLLSILMLLSFMGKPTKTSAGLYSKIETQIELFRTDSTAMSGAILGGIMIMIVGFATLVIGNYIIYGIIMSLPGLNSAAYNTTQTAILSYVSTTMPIFGLALMVLGFGIILYTLRTSMGGEGEATR